MTSCAECYELLAFDGLSGARAAFDRATKVQK